MLIRKMKKDDWADVKGIYSYAIKEGRSTFQTKCPDYEQWDNEHLPDCKYVVEVDKKVVAWCAISKTSSKKAYWGSVELSIYVDNNYRGQKIGQALLEFVIKESEKLGYWSLYSVIFSDNIPSINLHKKCGFRVIGYREKVAKDIFGTWNDVTLMERRNDIV